MPWSCGAEPRSTADAAVTSATESRAPRSRIRPSGFSPGEHRRSQETDRIRHARVSARIGGAGPLELPLKAGLVDSNAAVACRADQLRSPALFLKAATAVELREDGCRPISTFCASAEAGRFWSSALSIFGKPPVGRCRRFALQRKRRRHRSDLLASLFHSGGHHSASGVTDQSFYLCPVFSTRPASPPILRKAPLHWTRGDFAVGRSRRQALTMWPHPASWMASTPEGNSWDCSSRDWYVDNQPRGPGFEPGGRRAEVRETR